MIGKALGKTVAQLLSAAAIVLAVCAHWRSGDPVFAPDEERPDVDRGNVSGVSEGVTPAAAEATAARIRAFRDPRQPELRLESNSPVLRYRLPDLLPPGVIHPVKMESDRKDIRASVLPAILPRLPDPGGIAGILPDTVPLLVRGSLALFGEDGSMLQIRAIEVQGIPVSPSAFPDTLVAVGTKETQGLPESAMLVPAFGGIRCAHIDNGELVLVRA